MNNTYKITIGSPLLRPGITIETEVSERYVVPVLREMMEQVREFNEPALNTPGMGQVLMESSDNPPVV